MSVVLAPLVIPQFFGGNTSGSSPNVPLSGGLLWIYAAGTTTPVTTYTNNTGLTPNTNPMVLDSTGRLQQEIWLTTGASYKFVLMDSVSNVIATWDNIQGLNDLSNSIANAIQKYSTAASASQTLFNLGFTYVPGVNALQVYLNGSHQASGLDYTETSSTSITLTVGATAGDLIEVFAGIIGALGSTTATNVGYLPPFTGSVATNVASKLGQTVSVLDFGADPTGVADSTAGIQAAFSASANGTLNIPPGTYLFGANFSLTPPGTLFANIVGAGIDSVIFKFTNAGDGLYLGGNTNISGVTFLTTNAAAGTALRVSGLQQRVEKIRFSVSGAGVWGVGLKVYGTVSSVVMNTYLSSSACTIGVSVEPNGTNAVGNASFIGCEIRALTTGIHFTGAYNVLSSTMYACAIESCGTNGILVDGGGSSAPSISIYGGYFESNGTNDINHQSGGDFSIFEANHVTGTTNALNFSNAACTSRLRLYGVIVWAQAGGNILLGANISFSSLIGCSASWAKLTNSAGGKVTMLSNFSVDGTYLPNTICDDGIGYARLQYKTASYAYVQQLNNANGVMTTFNNGVQSYTIDGSGNIVLSHGFTLPGGTPLLATTAAITGGGTGNVPTLTAGPVTGNPTKWIPINDGGATRYIPAW